MQILGRKKIFAAVWAGLSLLPIAGVLAAEPALKIVVQALFPDRAVLEIQGRRRVLLRGETSPEGVRLVAADAAHATLEVGGAIFTADLDAHISSQVAPRIPARSVRLVEASDGQFYVEGSINGNAMRFVVDTGASTIALNANAAKRLGLLYRVDGTPLQVETAAGPVRAYALRLRNVKIQSISLNEVDAVVIDGAYPTVTLLGQSLLRRLDMARSDNVLELRER
ncbi:MAG: TIGR02281 family clan AA aspartic protease [Gammaproteobacteria bacterium]|nr:TIGR02281 family clan AA aspartic protease [Gammaproteobacteria bacterium]